MITNHQEPSFNSPPSSIWQQDLCWQSEALLPFGLEDRRHQSLSIPVLYCQLWRFLTQTLAAPGEPLVTCHNPGAAQLLVAVPFSRASCSCQSNGEHCPVQPSLNGAQPSAPCGPTAAYRQQTSHHRVPAPILKSPKPHFIRPLAAEGILSVVESVDCAVPRIRQLLLVFMLLLRISPPGLIWKGHGSQLHFTAHREDNPEPLITVRAAGVYHINSNKMPIAQSAAYSTCYIQIQQKSKVTV